MTIRSMSCYLRDLLSHTPSDDYAEFLLAKFENEAEKDIALSKMLAKIGPVLGLIGTLISMSPALVGLSTGDISGMAYNMQVVFATTVVGLVVRPPSGWCPCSSSSGGMPRT